MNKVFVIGDPHFKVANIKDTDLMVSKILQAVKQENPHFIVVLGDILDRHESIHVSPLTRAINFIKDLSLLAFTYLLIGNHDLKNNKQFLSDEHPFVSLKYWKNICVCDTTTIENINNQKFVFVPYVPIGRFEEALCKVSDWQSATCIFAHQEFRGCRMGAILSEEGDKWPLEYPLVVSGHIHDYQIPLNNIIYIGTPIQHGFGDKTLKTVSLFTYDEKQYTEKRIDLGIPRKETIHVNFNQLNKVTIPDNVECKIVVSGTTAEIKSVVKHPQIEKWKNRGYKIVYKDIPVEEPITNTEVNHNITHEKFSSILYNKIKDNTEIKNLFSEIFSY